MTMTCLNSFYFYFEISTSSQNLLCKCTLNWESNNNAKLKFQEIMLTRDLGTYFLPGCHFHKQHKNRCIMILVKSVNFNNAVGWLCRGRIIYILDDAPYIPFQLLIFICTLKVIFASNDALQLVAISYQKEIDTSV